MDLSSVDKYQHKPFPGSSHSWAIAKCFQMPANSRVLDIGCGPGVIGSALKDAGYVDLYAVEIDEQARQEAAKIYKQVETNIDPFLGVDLSKEENKFDLILLMDVLEHLADPFSFLKTVASLLKKDGRILLSLPNIAHWSVRIPLIFGFFEYANRGILDRTHMQFFTCRRFKLLIEQAALSILEKDASIPPLEFVLPSWIWNNPAFRLISKAHLILARVWPSLFAYQNLALLSLNKNIGVNK